MYALSIDCGVSSEDGKAETVAVRWGLGSVSYFDLFSFMVGDMSVY